MSLLAAVLVLGLTGPAAAQSTLQSTQAPPLFSPTPAVLGEVEAMDSHSVTVATARDEHMDFQFDSRTMMPFNMPSGMRVKVEFTTLPNGERVATRIARLEHGSLDWQALDRQLALAETSEDSRLAADQQAEDELSAADREEDKAEAHDRDYRANNPGTVDQNYGQSSTGTNDNVTANPNDNGTMKSSTSSGNNNDTDDNDKDDTKGAKELPKTASMQPVLLLLGAAATSFALGMTFGRRRRTV
jgi:LPXTG-motif cell wall-anchored protein